MRRLYHLIFLSVFHRGESTNLHFALDYSSGSGLQLNLVGRRFTLTHHRIHSDDLNVYTDVIPMCGPVAIITTMDDGFTLILNSTHDLFAESCIPDSIVTTGMSTTGGLAVSLSVVDTERSSYVLQVRDFEIGFGTVGIGSIPDGPFDFIVERFEALGAVSDGTSFPSFSNCDFDMVGQLPTLEYVFPDGDRFTIEPTKYISISPENRMCQMEVSRCELARHCLLNPLAVGHVNIRVTPQNTFQVCDSIH